MAHRSGDVAVVRSVGSPLAEDGQKSTLIANEDDTSAADNDEDGDLPQCKIKRNYSCNLCPFFSQNPRSFLYHSRDVHFDRIKIYECSQCLYASKHSQKLQRHINMIHVNGKNRTKRVEKTAKVEKKKELKAIKPKTQDAVSTACPAPEPENQGNDVSPISFERCGNEEDDDQYVDEEEELLDKELKCSACSFSSRSPSLMRRHERVVHLKKRFLRCNKCSYVTHVKARYTKHVKYHSMPMIKCDLCDFRTPYKWNLDRHYKNHCGSGAFQCSKCNFRADIKQSLTVHEMNHHVPPVGQGAVMARKKNKVGASETNALESDNIDKEELELLQMEREDAEPVENEEVEAKGEDTQKAATEKRVSGKRNLQHLRTSKLSCKRESVNNNLQTDFIHPDDIVPRYGQIYVKTLKCKFCSYKAVFSHEIWRHEKRIHDYVRPESKKEKLPVRPPPKLIPLQTKVSPTPPSSPILKIPAVRNKTSVPENNAENSDISSDKSVNEKEFTEMCKKSCLTSSLKDFVSLIGDEEGLKTIPDSQGDIDLDRQSWTGSCDENELKNSEEANKRKQTDLLKKKNASFFDKLKEKLLTGTSENCNLVCDYCGHESKCLSEAVAHQKRHSTGNRSDSEGLPENDIVLSGAELSSTRCQHCRHRCKTSTDLINHLKSCKAFGAAHFDQQPKMEDGLDIPIKCEEVIFEDEVKIEDDGNPMENRVFVWNELPQMHENLGEEEEEMEEAEAMEMDVPCNEDDFEGEPTPMYGTITSKGADNTESGMLVAEIDPRLSLTVKKVFKCPHCSFWASTASRFHVHIVGHLNKKPFECSLCLYRSNWRWDITKHIRLKSARDPSHLEAKVNMTDETGRRNYSKYNKYLTMMKVHEPSAESSGTGRRSKACDATQGTATENDIIPLPAPPRLTRAPTPGTAYQIPQGAPLRPPPPLKAAHPIPPIPTTKKTLWKCKKCNFRDSNKEFVLSHVKEHYGKKTSHSPLLIQSPNLEEVTEDAKVDPTGSTALFHKTPPFRCGHCHQVSNWKHVIQRHCRLKHNGYVLIELDWKDDTNAKNSLDPAMSLDAPGSMEESSDTISCDICPFTTDTEGDLIAHKLNHVDRPGSIFKCTYCPFYVPSKIAVLEHMEVHGIECGVQLTSMKFDNFEPSDCNEDFLKHKSGNSEQQPKRYKCRQCPYVSNSKTQFLYHKQFHKPRESPFKCMYCSYNVSRRHLLHQHLRVHDSSQRAKRGESLPEMALDPAAVRDSKTAEMTEIPLVWVYKFGTFSKMFKCRWCPHVNARKINIQEHEKMHRSDRKGASDNSHASKLQCSDCNYTCNNAGVLSSHVKVHQGFYGEIRSLVDPNRSDAEQIQRLQSATRIVEPEVVISVMDAENEGERKQKKQQQVESDDNKDEEPSPEASYNQSSHTNEPQTADEKKKVLSFCGKCPARFFLKRELRIHSKFHLIRSPFGCLYCSYTARQRPHLLSHYKVHSEEYQRRSAELAATYVTSQENPRLKTVVIAKNSDYIEGPVWMLEKFTEERLRAEGKAKAKHACSRCPAKFFKLVALQYHLSLHGKSHRHKCKYCDYAVKTYANLMRHQLVHEEGDDSRMESKSPDSEDNKSQSDDSKTKPAASARKMEPLLGAMILGSPKFIYPTYLKNGKIKEKRYKCHKCPSAFEKREQYRIHASLHGSKQKYRCEKCDYSVKYYANYIQHMRKHRSHDEAVEAQKAGNGALDSFNEEGAETFYPAKASSKSDDRAKLPGEKGKASGQRTCKLPLLEQQMLMLQERKKKMNDAKGEEEKSYWCAYCPYVSIRQDAVDSHTRRHLCVSGVKLGYKCMHCDYSTSQATFLNEHTKLHFNKASRHKAEAYLKCEKMELWCIEEKEKEKDEGFRCGTQLRTLLFKDKGESYEDRFFPPVPDTADENEVGEDEEDWKMYVNPETGEPVEKGEIKEERGEEEEEGEVEEVGAEEAEEAEEEVEAGEVEGSEEADEPDEVEEVVEVLDESEDSSAEHQLTIDLDGDDPMSGQLESGDDLIEMVEEHLEEVQQEEASLNEEEEMKLKRWRGKKWKCKKCPHAFRKKDQYLRHASLHGSNQRHSCDICDYSVKFYTNYLQHMKMHQFFGPKEKRAESVKKNEQREKKSLKLAKEGGCAEEENVVEVGDYESECIVVDATEKMVVEQCEEIDPEYSSLDGTEGSFSSEEALAKNVQQNANSERIDTPPN